MLPFLIRFQLEAYKYYNVLLRGYLVTMYVK
ncbi:hypothetical protein BVRB_018040, partial [Beta vulgaris subsp. vulgaris]